MSLSTTDNVSRYMVFHRILVRIPPWLVNLILMFYLTTLQSVHRDILHKPLPRHPVRYPLHLSLLPLPIDNIRRPRPQRLQPFQLRILWRI